MIIPIIFFLSETNARETTTPEVPPKNNGNALKNGQILGIVMGCIIAAVLVITVSWKVLPCLFIWLKQKCQ